MYFIIVYLRGGQPSKLERDLSDMRFFLLFSKIVFAKKACLAKKSCIYVCVVCISEVQLKPYQFPLVVCRSWPHILSQYSAGISADGLVEPILILKRNVFLSRQKENEVILNMFSSKYLDHVRNAVCMRVLHYGIMVLILGLSHMFTLKHYTYTYLLII